MSKSIAVGSNGPVRPLVGNTDSILFAVTGSIAGDRAANSSTIQCKRIACDQVSTA
jgi:hypothetical protein